MTEGKGFGAVPPHDLEAEMGALGSMMLSPEAYATVVATLQPTHFYRPQHAWIFEAAVDLWGRGEPVDQLTVRAELTRRGQMDKFPTGAVYLHDLVSSVPTPMHAGTYARAVLATAKRRLVVQLGHRAAQRGYNGGDDVDDVLADIETELRAISAHADTRITGFSTAGEFVDEPDPRNDTIIPGVLDVQDRVIVVAAEGAGKSTLARHVWVCVAAGINPFSFVDIPPKRTLLIDLENPPALVRRKSRGLVALGRQVTGWEDDRCWRWTRPGGLDLKRPRDQHLLDRVISDARCDLMLMGPLYKSFVDGGERAEQLNSQVAAFLDRMRDKHKIALWLETHAPLDQNGQRSLRPMGSGVWSRWPEFGIVLRRTKDENDPPHTLVVERFRGDRDERSWPDKLRRGKPWPFEGVFGKDTYSDPRPYDTGRGRVCPACTWPTDSLAHQDKCGVVQQQETAQIMALDDWRETGTGGR